MGRLFSQRLFVCGLVLDEIRDFPGEVVGDSLLEVLERGTGIDGGGLIPVSSALGVYGCLLYTSDAADE